MDFAGGGISIPRVRPQVPRGARGRADRVPEVHVCLRPDFAGWKSPTAVYHAAPLDVTRSQPRFRTVRATSTRLDVMQLGVQAEAESQQAPNALPRSRPSQARGRCPHLRALALGGSGCHDPHGAARLTGFGYRPDVRLIRCGLPLALRRDVPSGPGYAIVSGNTAARSGSATVKVAAPRRGGSRDRRLVELPGRRTDGRMLPNVRGLTRSTTAQPSSSSARPHGLRRRRAGTAGPRWLFRVRSRRATVGEHVVCIAGDRSAGGMEISLRRHAPRPSTLDSATS